MDLVPLALDRQVISVQELALVQVLALQEPLYC
jgi:hypothetical protein